MDDLLLNVKNTFGLLHFVLILLNLHDNHEIYKQDFIDKVYFSENYRKISKEEACIIQGFPKDFKLPETRARWMKLIGNSVSVSVIDMLTKTIIKTGVFDDRKDQIEQIKKYEMPTTYIKNSGVSALN